MIAPTQSPFATLGYRLCVAKTAGEAAEIIFDVADQLIGWNACTFDLYCAQEDKLEHVLNVDTLDGRRLKRNAAYDHSSPSALARRAILEGGQLVLKEPPYRVLPGAVPFGDVARPSASILCVPVKNGAQVIGLLSIHSYRPGAYHRHDLATLQALADHCGGALERIRKEEALERRARLAALSADIGRALTSKNSLREILRLCAEALVGRLDAAMARMWTLEEQGNNLELQASAGLRTNLDGQHARVPVGRYMVGLIAQTRKPVLTNHFQKDAHGRDKEWARKEGVVSFAGYPLLVEDRLTGVLAIFSNQPIDEFLVRELASVAYEIALGIERKRADEALRAAQQRLKHVLAHSPALIYSFKPDGHSFTPNMVSDNIQSLLGYSHQEASQTDWWMQCVHPQDRELVLSNFTRLLTDQHAALEYRIRHKDGTYRWIRDEQRVVETDSGGPTEIVGSWMDITERKLMEEQLRQAQKIEAVGQLAGGVAHDFNNLLTVIRGCCEMLLLRDHKLIPDSKDLLKQVVAASERAANLTRQLLAFGRKQVMQSQPLSLNDIVGDVTKMLARVIGEDISLHCTYASELPLVRADAGMIEQVLMNLVINARDAMPGGGDLSISTEYVSVGEQDLTAHPQGRAGTFACLSVQDTGSGIAPQDLPRIFEPFFTTKEIGKGTGLGLSTVYGIVQQHQGWVEVASEVGKGTAFRVFLPVISAVKLNTATASPELPIQGGSETILLVEDDEPVRLLGRRILETLGYRILEASSGTAALEVWKCNSTGIDLLLTDIIMPDGVTGRELAQRLWAERSDLRVILTSGYSADVLAKHTDFFRRHKSFFLPKPYSWRTLAQTVRKSLDQ